MTSFIGLIFPKLIPAATVENFGVRPVRATPTGAEHEDAQSHLDPELVSDLDELLDAPSQ
jgi:hypothetical protein